MRSIVYCTMCACDEYFILVLLETLELSSEAVYFAAQLKLYQLLVLQPRAVD